MPDSKFRCAVGHFYSVIDSITEIAIFDEVCYTLGNQ